MSGYGPLRGWRGSNAWGTASPQRTEETMSDRPADPQHDAAMHGVAEKWLTEMRNDYNAYRQSHAHEGAFACCSAHAVADRVPTLVAALDAIRGTLAAYVERESADAAAGSYAGRAEEAEAEVERLRVANKASADEYDAALLAIHEARDHWQERAVAEFERAEKAEAALAEMRGWYDEDTAMLQRILEAHDEDEAYDWVPDNLSRTVSEMRKSMRDRLFQRKDDADLVRAADKQGVQPVRDISELGAGEKPTPEEFAAFDAARREGGGDV